MAQKIVVTKPGYNASTETSPDNMVYSSDYDTLKYHVSGTIQSVVSGSDKEVSITHGLGYIPFFVVFCNTFDPGGDYEAYSPLPFWVAGFPASYAVVGAYADSSKIYFRVETNSANVTLVFAYKVFRNNTGL
jgi:hypothetical protein